MNIFDLAITVNKDQGEPKFNGRDTLTRCNFLPKFMTIGLKVRQGMHQKNVTKNKQKSKHKNIYLKKNQGQGHTK